MAETPRALRSSSVPATRIADSPDKTTLRGQVSELRSYLFESQEWAKSELTSQKISFEAAAAQFESVARDASQRQVHEAEISAASHAADSLAASMVAKDREAVSRVRNIEQEADISMVRYRQTVDAESDVFAKSEMAKMNE